VPNETDKESSAKKSNGEFISIIYNKRNDSPKYFELKKSKILFFVIGLPTITLIALVLGVIGLVHTSPFRLIDTYRQDSIARESIAKTNALQNAAQKLTEEKETLAKELATAQEQLKTMSATPTSAANTTTSSEKCPAPPVCPAIPPSGTVSSIGLSTLSFFHPIQGQRDRTRPATITLSGFKTVSNRDTTNLQFNIIPAASGEGKVSGHILVLMKNELMIEVYPLQALNTTSTQINYSAGEPFSTQRFRPVDASFLKPRKSGNTIFTVFIFAKNGDLLHYQSVTLPVKI
jgi:hypothetical protein